MKYVVFNEQLSGCAQFQPVNYFIHHLFGNGKHVLMSYIDK